MSNFLNKVDFAVILLVKNANPNGDPLNGNRPRENYEGFGEISDVCIKRKIRNRLQDLGQEIFVQSDERRTDGFRSLKDRADGCAELKKAGKDKEQYAAISCHKWIDVRSFGQVFAFKKANDDNAVSIGIRGPVSIHSAVSVTPIEISSIQITKSVNGETGKDPDKKSPDTMGMKHRVDFGVYVFYGSINTQLAAKTGFSEEDRELLKKALITLFENDCSSARPDGSMEICKVYWWKHNSQSGQYSSAKVHRSLKVVPTRDNPKSIEDFKISHEELAGLSPEIYDGI
ncbi:type I-C CRISPR-associated protein Cas7/Csd2 [Desulfotomaculum sp. 1211_IL3151]|uniref:type I-C CRISPR-associated protein Cas7/Csd2 n=1 Tax=Desulfotomaculum sp. 1211_IL3151 TaxID=3084055 RepID=UPI002FD8CEF0